MATDSTFNPLFRTAVHHYGTLDMLRPRVRLLFSRDLLSSLAVSRAYHVSPLDPVLVFACFTLHSVYIFDRMLALGAASGALDQVGLHAAFDRWCLLFRLDFVLQSVADMRKLCT